MVTMSWKVYEMQKYIYHHEQEDKKPPLRSWLMITLTHIKLVVSQGGQCRLP